MLDDGRRHFDAAAVTVVIPDGTRLYVDETSGRLVDEPPEEAAFFVADPNPDGVRMKIATLDLSHVAWAERNRIYCSLLPVWSEALSARLRALPRQRRGNSTFLTVYDREVGRFLTGLGYSGAAGPSPRVAWQSADEVIAWRTGLGLRPTGAGTCVYANETDMSAARHCISLNAALLREGPDRVFVLGLAGSGFRVALTADALSGPKAGDTDAMFVGFVNGALEGFAVERLLTSDDVQSWRAYVTRLDAVLAGVAEDRAGVLAALGGLFEEYPGRAPAPPPARETVLAEMLAARRLPGVRSSALQIAPWRLSSAYLAPSCLLDDLRHRLQRTAAILERMQIGRPYSAELPRRPTDPCALLFGAPFRPGAPAQMLPAPTRFRQGLTNYFWIPADFIP